MEAVNLSEEAAELFYEEVEEPIEGFIFKGVKVLFDTKSDTDLQYTIERIEDGKLFQSTYRSSSNISYWHDGNEVEGTVTFTEVD